jgi:hypothetical protein
MKHDKKSVNDSEEGVEHTTEFTPSKGLTSVEAEKKLLEWGRNELEDKKTPKVKFCYYNILTIILLFLFVDSG